MCSEKRDMIDIMVLIMRNRKSDSNIIERAANVIAADARFNARFCVAKRMSRFQAEPLDLMDFAYRVVDECEVIEAQYQEGEKLAEIGRLLSEMADKIDRKEV